MSTLTQFLLNGSGSSGASDGIVPVGCFAAINGQGANPLIKSGDAYFVKSGTRIYDLPPATLADVKGSDYVIPDNNTSVHAGSQGLNDSIAFGNGVYVLSYAQGIFRSTDAVSWTPVYPGSATNPSGFTSKVMFGAGKFVVIIDEIRLFGNMTNAIRIAVSTDALNWETYDVRMQPVNITTPLKSNPTRYYNLDYAGGYFWISRSAIDDVTNEVFQSVARSVDGVSWTLHGNVNGSTNGAAHPMKAVVNTALTVVQFVPVSYGSFLDAATKAMASTLTGAPAVVGWPANSATNAKFLNGQFVATLAQSPVSISTIATAPGATASNWTVRTTPVAFEPNDVTFGAGVYVVVGSSGTICTSTDAITWTQRTSGTTDSLRAIEWDAALSRFICVGSSTIRTSVDGITWTAATVPSSLGTYSANPYDRLAMGVKMLKVGSTWFAMLGNGGALLSSTDGVTWSLVLSFAPTGSTTVRTTQHASTQSAAMFEHNGRLFYLPVTAGITTCLKADGAWRTVEPSQVYTGVAYGAGVYVAVGSGGVIKTSTDGLTWTARTSGTAVALTGVVWTGTAFIAITGNAAIRSVDGITWASAGSNGGAEICVIPNGVAVHVPASQVVRVSVDHGVTWDATTLTGQFTRITPFSKGCLIWGGISGVCVVRENGTVLHHQITTNANPFVTAGEIDGYLYFADGAGQYGSIDIASMLSTGFSGLTTTGSAGLIQRGASSANQTVVSNVSQVVKTGPNQYAYVGSSNTAHFMVGYDMWYSDIQWWNLGTSSVVFYDDNQLWSLSITGRLRITEKNSVSALCPIFSPYTTQTGNSLVAGAVQPSSTFYRRIK